MRVIDRNKLHPAFHEACDEGNIARQAVKLGNHQHGPAAAAQIERGGKLGAIVLSAAFHLRKLCRQLALAMEEARDGRALRVETKAASPLAGSGDAIIGDVSGHLFTLKRWFECEHAIGAVAS